MKVKKLLKDEKGAVMPLVAAILGLFALGFIALAVDAGTLYVERKAMITSADAAALAGAQVLRVNQEEIKSGAKTIGEIESEAKTTAENYGKANGADLSQVDVYVGPKSVKLPGGTTESRQVVEVTVGKNQSLIFARFLGDENTDVKAYAIATWGYIKKTYIGSFVPLFVFDTDYKLNTDIFLHEKIKGSNNSYGFIDIASGMGDIKQAIAGNTVGGTYIYNNLLDGKPGNGESVYGAVVTRMETAQSKATAEERRKTMIGLVPVIDYNRFKTELKTTNFQLDKDGNIKLDADGYMQLNSQLKLPIKYFAYYEIIDVIKQGETVGSEEALNPESEYTGKGIPPFDYSGKIPTDLLNNNGNGADNTIVLGRFTGEIVNAKTFVEVGDQTDPNPEGDTPAPYSKLIK